MQPFRCLQILALVSCIVTSGCISIPPVDSASNTTQEALFSHVSFLARPELKGRKSGTRGSRLARTYIQRRFASFGLKPWAGESFDLDFGFGRNVLGVIPGSDPVLGREIVLVSAHYDHEGKKAGRIHPGAADNASGVAVLLELARELSRDHPARSVAFAAFDAEEKMMLGSFAFAARQDVADAPLAAVVNLDMLGRDFLDVVTNTIFVSGAEFYPALLEQVCENGTNADIRVLPIGTDLVGPRSDHVAFEDRDIPCLFFSCGTCPDYHQPTDTIEKLDFPAIHRSFQVALQTVLTLANGPAPESREPNQFFSQELTTIGTVLAEAVGNTGRAHIRDADIEKFKSLEATARRFLEEHDYNRERREHLAVEASGILAPYAMPFAELNENQTEEQRNQLIWAAKFFQAFYFKYPGGALEGYHRFTAQLLAHHPGIFRRMPPFHYEVFKLPEDRISFEETTPGHFELHALAFPIGMTAGTKRSKWLVNTFTGSLNVRIDSMDCEGTREEVGDYCLLAWWQDRTNTARAAELEKLYRRVANVPSGGTRESLVQDRLDRGGFPNATAWLIQCFGSENSDLVGCALNAAGEREDSAFQQALPGILENPRLSAHVRAQAIRLVDRNNPKGLRAICSVLSGETPEFSPDQVAWMRPDYPFANDELLKTVLPATRNFFAQMQAATNSLGELACERLQKLTGRDLGKDAEAWTQWIDQNVQ